MNRLVLTRREQNPFAWENAIYRLSGGIVARVSRPGQAGAAAREVRVARWLEVSGIAAVRVLPGVDLVVVGSRTVTFWVELPPHRHGTARQVAVVLRRLHALPVPLKLDLPPLSPFVRLRERIDAAETLPKRDRDWLLCYLADLRGRYAELPAGREHCAIHGDAWIGNVVATDHGQVLIDLERFSVGPPEWDLVSTAVRLTSFGTLDTVGYDDFCATYGYDVISWPGFQTLRDIRELRACSYMLQYASRKPAARREAAIRVACLRGQAGPRPWTWTAIV